MLPEARATFWHTVHVRCYRISSLRTALCVAQGLLLPTQPLLKLHPLIVLHPLFFQSAINAGKQKATKTRNQRSLMTVNSWKSEKGWCRQCCCNLGAISDADDFDGDANEQRDAGGEAYCVV